jgi:hypothetical protein
MEARYNHLYRRNQQNYKLLQQSLKSGIDNCELLLYNSIPRTADIVRWHVSGDFFCWRYFVAFCRMIAHFPHITFYVHTKAIRYVQKYYLKYKRFPPNLNISLSYGGKDDQLISSLNMKSSRIVKNEQEAQKLGLPIDRNDSFAYMGKRDYCLLLHGVQKRGTIS